MLNSKEWIQKLKLTPHPEGGYFNEVYRSTELINKSALPERYKSDRCFGTSIYFLLESGQFSSFHKLKSDETWHFYYGIPIDIYILSVHGNLEIVTLGNNIFRGEQLQYTIPKNHWFGAAPRGDNHFSLVGCTVYPGFDFLDFELGNRKDLIKMFPYHTDVILQLTNR